jgi:hypothetical protein
MFSSQGIYVFEPLQVRNESIAIDPVTGQKTVSVDHNPNTLQWGLALEYSLIYLQQHVKDIGLKAPFNHLIPLVEFSMSTPLNRGVNELTTGTINPGVIWSGQYYQESNYTHQQPYRAQRRGDRPGSLLSG